MSELQVPNYDTYIQTFENEIDYTKSGVKAALAELKLLLEWHYTNQNIKSYTNQSIKSHAEGLALKCPVLTGPWEYLLWVVVRQCRIDYSYFRNSASCRLSAWLIYVMGDPDICPNPFLRLELINVVDIMVDDQYFNDDDNCQHALESVLSACSILTLEYITTNMEYCTNYFDLKCICNVLKLILENTYSKNHYNIDRKFANDLNYEKHSKLHTIINDFTFKTALRPSMCSHTMKINGIKELLKTIAKSARVLLKSVQMETKISFQNSYDMSKIASTLEVIMMKLYYSWKSSQLFELTTSSFMDVLEMAICMGNKDPFLRQTGRSPCLVDVDKMAITLLSEREEGLQYIRSGDNHVRLLHLRSVFLGNDLFEPFPLIKRLLVY